MHHRVHHETRQCYCDVDDFNIHVSTGLWTCKHEEHLYEICEDDIVWVLDLRNHTTYDLESELEVDG